MYYYGGRISDNIRKREPEGYLICANVPIARSGTQQYLQDEIGQSGDRPVTVFRPEEEVFSPATMASFEGMPVTNDHPDGEDGVTVDNVQYLSKGHCQNIRRGTGADKDLLIADLIITDQNTIQDILDGKREISCGYNYELHEEDGKLVQRQIRGNHVAIVDKGRAGHRVCIKDSAPNHERRKGKMAKTHNGILAKMLAKFAIDADPDDLELAVDAVEELTSAPAEPAPAPAPQEPTEETEDAEGGDPMQEILARLEALEAKVGMNDEAPEEDPLDRLEKDLDEIEGKSAPVPAEEAPAEAPAEEPAEAESQFVDPEEVNEQDEDEVAEFEEEEEEEEEFPGEDCNSKDKRACDAARMAISAVRPLIAALPPSQRKKASDAAVASIRKASGLSEKPTKNSYVALKARKKASDTATDVSEIGKRIMAARNPHYQK